eukprot:6213585-Pleurochrysis_carterae.AAC.3
MVECAVEGAVECSSMAVAAGGDLACIVFCVSAGVGVHVCVGVCLVRRVAVVGALLVGLLNGDVEEVSSVWAEQHVGIDASFGRVAQPHARGEPFEAVWRAHPQLERRRLVRQLLLQPAEERRAVLRVCRDQTECARQRRADVRPRRRKVDLTGACGQQ